MAVGIFAVFALLQYCCHRINLKNSLGTAEKGEAEEAPMRLRSVWLAVIETVTNLGGNVAVDLFLS